MSIKNKEENNNCTYRSQYLNYCGVRNKDLIIYGPFPLSITAFFFIYLQYIYLPTYHRSMCKSVYSYISLYNSVFFFSLYNCFQNVFFSLHVKSWPQDKLEQL